MMIVTHEMAFARSICNRVFYLDEGGIYEEGTPEQIFEHPQREKTRRFIRKLKLLEISVESRDHDFPGTVGQIEQYCSRSRIGWKTARRIQLAFEETVENLLMPVLEDPQIRVAIEYSPADDSAVMTFRYNGEKYDPIRNGDELSLALLRSAVTSMEYQEGSGDPGNCLVLQICG